MVFYLWCSDLCAGTRGDTGPSVIVFLFRYFTLSCLQQCSQAFLQDNTANPQGTFIRLAYNLRMKKIIIDGEVYGMVEIPDTSNGYRVFHAVKKAFSLGKRVTPAAVFAPGALKALEHYKKGGAREELAELQLAIEMGGVLGFDTTELRALKQRIELTNDTAHVHLNISKRLKLLNKQRRGKTAGVYLFWDIENFGTIGPMFTHVIEKFSIADDHIHLAANPDSLYLKRREWEAELYDYGKQLTSFNFTVVDHGKNVADDFLLDQFQGLGLKCSDIFIMTYDRELRERFKGACHDSNNLYTLGK